MRSMTKSPVALGLCIFYYAYRCLCQVVCGGRGFSSLSLTKRS